MREEFPRHFEALQQHPRLLVGEEVPDPKTGNMIRLRDSADATDWQAAMKHVLVAEIESRAAAKQGEMAGVFETVHSSIDLFRNNADLIPGAKQFDKELANEFAAAVKDYETRTAEGKLIGFSVPVQPLINQIRTRLTAQRAAASAPSAPAAAPTPQQQRVQEQPRTATGQWEAPQAGITSKAGSSGNSDDTAAGVMEAFFRQNGIRI